MFNNRQIHSNSQLQNPQIQNSNRLRYVRLVTTSMPPNNGTSKSANNGESRLASNTSTSPCGIIQNQLFVPPRIHSLVSPLNSSNQNISNTLHVSETNVAVVSFLILIIN
jgi:hypothetical protein